MDKNWPYVVAGYGLSFSVLSSYALWLRAKTKRVESSVSNEPLDDRQLGGKAVGGKS